MLERGGGALSTFETPRVQSMDQARARRRLTAVRRQGNGIPIPRSRILHPGFPQIRRTV